ncbi:MAG: poly-gamma-glutamate system protein [Sphingobacteriia bacterium]|nr:poly-gamma-glutamate system protein [Sphingobacteriia bacterium]
MYKFRAKSKIVLGLLFLLALLALIAVENGKMDQKQEWYKEKLEAAKLCQMAAARLKSHRLEKGVFVDVVNDPNQTALIGQEFTLITTDRGDIEAKLSSTNPNFAALIVQFLKEAGLRRNDHVAVAFTGSFPALNLAVLSALEALGMKPVIITSVGASNFGANDPYFTWLDMESMLVESGIFHCKSVAASIGGGSDIGRGLSPEGRELIIKAIERNGIELIYEKHVEGSIARRLEIYRKNAGQQGIKAFINVGGGIASLGSPVNGKLIPAGLTEFLPLHNFPAQGVIIEMGRQKVPIIHLLNINKLLQDYDLPESPVPLPEPGDGGIFSKKMYSIPTTAIATGILVLVIVLVYISEMKHHQLGTEIVDNDKPVEDQTNDDEQEYGI